MLTPISINSINQVAREAYLIRSQTAPDNDTVSHSATNNIRSVFNWVECRDLKYPIVKNAVLYVGVTTQSGVSNLDTMLPLSVLLLY